MRDLASELRVGCRVLSSSPLLLRPAAQEAASEESYGLARSQTWPDIQAGESNQENVSVLYMLIRMCMRYECIFLYIV